VWSMKLGSRELSQIVRHLIILNNEINQLS
jgi:hypothetical protein